jgi:iron complex transport system substrate-binding protein
LQELRAAEERYALFAPFKRGNVYTYDARHGAKGGSEFLELGYLRPDLVLKDLVKIAHPATLPNHTLFFYKKLE